MTESADAGQSPAERLRDLEAMLNAILDYEIIKLDPDGNVVSWSPGAEAVSGYRADEVIGRSMAIFQTKKDVASGTVERELQIARESGRYEFEGLRVRKGGQTYWASVVVAPITDDSGRVTGFVKVARDVSERRRAEAMFRDLLESAPDATVIVGADGRIRRINRQTEEMFGYLRDELVGREVEVLVPPRFRPSHSDFREGFFRAARVRPMGAGLELFAVRRDGTEFPVEISLSPLETDEGRVVTAAIRDVTERRAAEEDLAAARATQEVFAERDRIAADLHDLVIQRLFASGMALQSALNLSEPDSDVASRVERVVEDLDETIAEIRSTIYALSDRNRPGESAGLRTQIVEVVSRARDTLGFLPRLRFVGPIDSTVPAEVADNLLAVLQEALSNAARHAEASSVEVAVRGGEQVGVLVVDNGRGIGEPARRSGLENMAVRAERLGGSFKIGPNEGGGTRLEWLVPVGPGDI
jgi:PAS domain S-box-containing protein